MTTHYTFICEKCNSKNDIGQLFEALIMVSEGRETVCSACACKKKLHLKMGFALGVSGKDMKVTDVFVPTCIESWNDGNAKVEFYPMLVCCERVGVGSAYWMPYWHLVNIDGKIKRKYGQWAPFMNASHMDSLIKQANAKGYKIGMN